MELKFGQDCIVIKPSYGYKLYIFKGKVYDKAQIGNVYTVMNTPSDSMRVEEEYIFDLETAKKVIAEWVEKGGDINGKL